MTEVQRRNGPGTDSEEDIRMCLNCPLPRCNDCIGRGVLPVGAVDFGPEMETAVRNGYKAGKTDKTIANELGVSKVIVRSCREHLGIKRETRIGSDEDFTALHALGLTDAELAKTYNVSSGTVSSKRERLGLPRNSKQNGKKVEDDLLILLVKAGHTDSDVSRICNISKTTARRRRVKLGLPANAGRGIKVQNMMEELEP